MSTNLQKNQKEKNILYNAKNSDTLSNNRIFV